MKSSAHLLQTCTVSFAFSFATPLAAIAIGWVGLTTLGYLPGLMAVSQGSWQQIATVLATFGQGDSLQGSMVIALVFGLVGVLFDLCIPHRYEPLHSLQSYNRTH
jgi:hypothetical protein